MKLTGTKLDRTLKNPRWYAAAPFWLAFLPIAAVMQLFNYYPKPVRDAVRKAFVWTYRPFLKD